MANHKQVVGALPIGSVIKSGKHDYQVLEVLGAGGFGITYKVLRMTDHRIIALKEFFPNTLCERGDNNTMSYLKTNALNIATGMKDFITEAQRLDRQNISHPNIVSIDEVFKANNTAYYAMEYIDGLNLRQYIQKENHNKPMSEEQVLSVMRPVLQAVSLIHKNKLTHLDIKHENIVLTQERDGSLRPVLIDFGQAKHYDRKGNATSQLTNAGCSDGFAPQEQYLGLTQFTPQADVYAVSATLLYLLTAKTPVKSSEMSKNVIIGMLGDTVSPKIREAIVNGMKTDKNDRTQSIDQLAEELGIDISNQAYEGNVTRLLNVGKPSSSKSIVKPVIIAACVLCVIGCGILLINRKSTSTDIAATSVVQPTNSTEEGIASNNISSEVNAANEPASIQQSSPQSQETVEVKQPERPEPSTPTPAQSDAPSQAQENTPPATEEKPQNQPSASAPAPETTAPTSDDEAFKKAVEGNDWDKVKQLADKGYSKAYLPLAKYYVKKAKTHNLADQYAKKAKAAGIAGADDVISILDGMGYYD